MMKAVPSHQDNYARITLGIVIRFYQKCSDRVQHLTSTTDTSAELTTLPVLPLTWAQSAEITLCLADLKKTTVGFYPFHGLT